MAADNRTLADLRAALAGGDLDRADRLAALLADEAAPAALALIAETYLRRQRWRDAATAIDRIPQPDLPLRLKRNTARNFASLAQHRPDEYRRLVAAKPSTRYRLVPIAGQRLTIADAADPARPLILSPGGDPVAAVHQSLKELEPAMRDGGAIGLGGVGDGHLLGVLGRLQPKLFMDMRQAVWVIEPDLSLLLICFMLHDYSGPAGPIEQQRFVWFVGDDWADRFRTTLLSDPMLPPPTMVIAQSADRQRIMPAVKAAIADLSNAADAAARRVQARCDRMDARQLGELFSGRGPRRPRVMFITTRFSTVLQYATRDAAAGFQENGWDTHIVAEPTGHHRNSPAAIRMTMAAFEPDLVFQIDHLRHEHGDMFPPGLPFACWIQDHMPVLTSAAAGQAVGPRDFVLTFSASLFTDTYSYPPRQCIDMPMMLTAPKQWAGSERVDAPDLVYVSNVSQDPATLLPVLLGRAASEMRPLVSRCAGQINEHYISGGSICSRQDLRTLLDETCLVMNMPPLAPQAARQVVEILWNPLNIALYRQQALGWTADAAETLGLSLGVYGQGWEQHPRFARFARGRVKNGPPLAALMRSARINLNLEPYTCFTHQRLLDGLSAGGFFLIREFAGNASLQELANLLDEQFDGQVQTAAQALAAADGHKRRCLQRLLARAACVTFSDEADPVRQVRGMQRAGVLVPQPIALPHLDEVSFATPAACRHLIELFAHDDATRADISHAQRRSIEHRLSFAAGMRRVVARIADLLTLEAAADSATKKVAPDNIAHAA